MLDVDAKRLCEQVHSSASGLCECLSAHADVPSILARFWTLEDMTLQLVAAASDAPREVFLAMHAAYPCLLVDVERAIQPVNDRPVTGRAAIRSSSIHIRTLLLRLSDLERTHPSAGLT